jgi:TetR/AcrR family transcriptional regulator
MQQQDPSDSDARRRRILDAALAVCEERGVHAARMEEVAALAQVSKGTLYRFYESKEELFLDSIIDSYERGRQVGAVGRAEATDPVERLRRRLDGLASVLSLVSRHARVHFQAWGVVGDSPTAAVRLNDFLTRFHRERHAEYEELVRAGQREGRFRADVDANTLAHCIGGLVSGFIYRAAFDPASANPDALRACFDVLVLRVLGIDAPLRERGDPDE